ncbi:hypothetical protein [Shewanella woodyi]|uniref:hypothetical protein n=1 Tax=Shewanella woodyi TaxID=60961 RepID=UPI0037495DFF
MIVSNLPPILQSNQLTSVSEGKPVITPDTWGGDLQPPPKIQSNEMVTYSRGISGMTMPTSVDNAAERVHQISIKV